MSDFFRKQPDPNAPFRPTGRKDGGRELPAQEPYDAPMGDFSPADESFGMGEDSFAAYASPSMPANPFPEWGAPNSAPTGEGFLMDEPAPFGAEMQQGGVPLFSNARQAELDFLQNGDSAPTRIARPVSLPQKVSKRTTVERSQQLPFTRPVPPREDSATVPAKPAQPDASPFARPVAAASPFARPAAPSDQNDPGIASDAPVRRRRMDRHPELPPAVELPVAQDPSFDPFEVGDSEVLSSAHSVEESPVSPKQREALPGGRYTGARTALPAGGVQRRPGGLPTAQGRANASQSNDGDANAAPKDHLRAEGINQRRAQPGAPMRRPAQQDQRPLPQGQGQQGKRPIAQGQGQQGQRPIPQGQQGQHPLPQGQGSQGQRPIPQGQQGQRPIPQGQRPQGQRMPAGLAQGAQEYAYEGSNMPVRRQLPMNADGNQQLPARKQPPRLKNEDTDGYNPHASVKRKPYDFENEDEDSEEIRRGGFLLPVLIVLLVLGGVLAGICLPNWKGMGGGIGTAMGSIQASVVSVFSDIKDMIIPKDEPIKSFSVAATENVAPTEIMFTIQTSKNAAGIRIEDDQGKILYERTYAPDMAPGEVIENSNALIWNPTCAIEEAYTGGFTVYARKSDGSQSEGMKSPTTIAIDAPKAVLPPVQSFTCDTSNATAPARIGFTLVTALDVTAARVVDKYNFPVAAMYDTDENSEEASFTDSANSRTWTLYADVEAAYLGEYTAQYQTADGGLNFTSSDFMVQIVLTADENAEDQGGEEEGYDDSEEDAAPDEDPTTPADDPPDANANGGTLAASVIGGDTPIALPASPEASEEPDTTDAPEPTNAPQPLSTPMPALTAEASEAAKPDAIGLKPTLYLNGKKADSYTRTTKSEFLSPFISMLDGESNYAVWEQAGVITFRGGPFRQNASFSTVEVENKKLTQLWSQPVGSMKINKATLHGVAAPGQPLIVKWPVEIRPRLGVYDEAKDFRALKEVIIAGQDGKIYFYNLLDGEPTRDPIDLGAPSAGGLSLATSGAPLLGVGQTHSKLSGKTVKNGYHLINLLTNKKEMLIECDGKDKNSNYTGVTGAALFHSLSGMMVFGSQNGVLYTTEIGSQEESYDHVAGKLSPKDDTQAYKTLASKQDKKNTKIDGSVAMYNNYAYYADQQGILQCVDINTLQPVWAINTGDNVDATPALDMEDAQTVALYTGNTILNQGKTGVCTIRRLNALTGAQDWAYEVAELAYTTEFEIGCVASPIVGQNAISDLVIFTVSKGKAGADVIALNKKSGAVVWKTSLTTTTISSPVAVYNEKGDAWIVQAESNGSLHLLDGLSGEILNTLKLDAQLEASPAVYGNLLIIGSTGKNTSAVYCIKID